MAEVGSAGAANSERLACAELGLPNFGAMKSQRLPTGWTCIDEIDLVSRTAHHKRETPRSPEIRIWIGGETARAGLQAKPKPRPVVDTDIQDPAQDSGLDVAWVNHALVTAKGGMPRSFGSSSGEFGNASDDRERRQPIKIAIPELIRPAEQELAERLQLQLMRARQSSQPTCEQLIWQHM